MYIEIVRRREHSSIVVLDNGCGSDVSAPKWTELSLRGEAWLSSGGYIVDVVTS